MLYCCITYVFANCVLGPGAKHNHLDVTFYVREKGRMHLGVSAHAGTQSGDAVSKCILKCCPTHVHL